MNMHIWNKIWVLSGNAKHEVSISNIHKTGVLNSPNGSQIFKWQSCLEPYSTGQRDHSTYTRVKCVQYGRFTRKIHANYTQETRVKFYTSYYTHLDYTWIACILARNETLFIHAKCVYFFTKESTGATVDCKKSLWIVAQQGQQAKLFEEANSCDDQQ